MEGARAVILAEAVEIADGRIPLPDTWRSALSGELFDQFWRETLSSLNPDELSIVLSVTGLTSQVAQAIRNRKRSESTDPSLCFARTILEQLETLFEGLAGVAKFHCISTVESVRGYLAYASQNWQVVDIAIHGANNADVALIEKGFGLMHLHRIQLLHNLARAEVRRGRTSVGIELATVIVKHLHGCSIQTAWLQGPWHSELLNQLPDELIGALVIQVAGECNYWRYRQIPQFDSTG